MSINAEHTAIPQGTEKPHIPLLVWLSCITAAAGGLLFGLHAGIMTGAIKFIHEEFHPTTVQEGWVIGAMLAGATIGTLSASTISNALGRKRPILLGGLLFFIGALLACMANSIEMLIVARVLLGLAIGIVSFVVPLYLSEVAPQHIRGTVIACFQLMITIGILVAYLINLAFSSAGNWAAMLGVTMIPAALMVIGVLFLAESPRWMASRGAMDAAEATLKRLTGSDAAAAREMSGIRTALERQSGPKVKGGAFFLRNGNFRRSVLLGILIQAMQQFAGINIVIYYAPKIFEMANFHGTTAQLWSTVAVGVVNLLATIVAVAFADRWGRKPILYAGFAIMAISMAVLGAILYVTAFNFALQIIAVLAVLVFIVGFAMSIGPLAWALCAEIQPTQGRDFGLGCSTIANWISNMVIAAYFLVVLDALGGPLTFALLAAANAVFFVLTFLLIPETKGVQLEEIEGNLMKGMPLRRLGR
ncbi:sugar porter family MFS transporter [Zymobacter palmae]|uniref:Permeases of the major facilitator n=1 Tax=Zymobacter palmae TaxID=33074 RepID=A0A348HIJ8_9GAMM|nr:sugar porter family MFS transporter [Zymobacter palmae]BBG31450.1 permeases of the major facilitator [Zymobacter palmae]